MDARVRKLIDRLKPLVACYERGVMSDTEITEFDNLFEFVIEALDELERENQLEVHLAMKEAGLL